MRPNVALFVCVPFLLIAACAVPAPPQPTASVSAPTTVTSAAAAATPEALIVRFDYGNAALAPAGIAVVDQAARLFREGNPVVMTVSGHSDRQGREYENLLLSARRAETVKQALVARGIPAARLQLEAFGISEPAVPTDPDAPQNRRVVITWR